MVEEQLCWQRSKNANRSESKVIIQQVLAQKGKAEASSVRHVIDIAERSHDCALGIVSLSTQTAQRTSTNPTTYATLAGLLADKAMGLEPWSSSCYFKMNNPPLSLQTFTHASQGD